MFGSIVIGEGNGNPLQYSCLENPMDRGAWWAAVHGVAPSRTRLSNFTSTFHFPALEKEMATHSSVLAWRIPGTGEPGGLPSIVISTIFILPTQEHGISLHLFYVIFDFFHQFSSVQFSHSVMSNSLQPHESQHTRPPCPSPSPGVHSDSHPSSQ